MPEFKKNNRFSGGARRPQGNFRPGAGRGFDQKELYDAECNSCHKMAQVPFRPNGKKPVYCSDCFKRDDDRPQQRFEKRDFGPSRGAAPSAPSFTKDPRIDELKRQLTTMNDTLERLVLAIETSNRASALSTEVRKHVPAAKPASAPAKKVPAKAAAKAPAKATVKPAAKKAAKKKA